MVMFYALMALCIANGALAQMTGWGPCPKVATMPDFDILQMQGRWFQSRRYFSLDEINRKCVTGDVRPEGSNGIMQMNMTAISRITGKVISINGTKIRVADPAEPGKLEVQAPSSTVWQKHWILGGDYKNYIVGYNCVDWNLMNLKYLWIWTRRREASKTVIDDAVKVIEKQNLNAKWLISVDQTNCNATMSSNVSA